MGWPMAVRLQQAGREPLVWDAAPAAIDRAREAGLSLATDLADLAGRAEVVVLSLPTPAVVRAVVAELWRVNPALLICDTSTIDPGTAHALAATGPYCDTPILGRPAGAGTWTIPISGDPALLDWVTDTLEPLAAHVVPVGASGSAATLKVCNNLMLSAINAVTAEALALAGAAGLDPATFVRVVLDSGAASVSGLFRDIAPRAVSGDFAPVFATQLMAKDAQLALDLAESVGVRLDVVAASQQLNRAAIEAGLGALDSIAVLRVLQQAGSPPSVDEPI